jgi:hypothetical protein
MSRYIQLIASLIVILTFTSCDSKASDSKKIFEGSFGINFGNTFEIKENINTVKRLNVLMYEIDPPSKIKYFDKYYVAITPKTHKIYAIYATKRYDDFLEARDNGDELHEILVAKYRPGNGLYYTDGGFIKVNTDLANNPSDLYNNQLTFYSLNLNYENIANQEKIELVENKDSL